MQMDDKSAPIGRLTPGRVLAFVLAVAAALAFYSFVGCPILFLTGLPCPGCGMMRAGLRLLRLDVAGALYYHPLVLLAPQAAYALLARRGPFARPKVKTAAMAVFALAMLAVWVLRVFVWQSAVPAPDPSRPLGALLIAWRGQT